VRQKPQLLLTVCPPRDTVAIMRRTFVTWSGASKGAYGPWVPIFRSRKKVDSRITVRVLALAAPNGVSTATPPFDVQLRYLPTERAVSQVDGDAGPLPRSKRFDTNDVIAETVYSHTSSRASAVAIDTRSPEGRGSLGESEAFSVDLESTLREDAAGRTLWMRVRHSAQGGDAPWGGSALLRIVVDESLVFPDGQERSFTLYHNPVMCGAVLHLPRAVRERCSISLQGESGEDRVRLLVDGKPQRTMNGTLASVEGDKITIPAMRDVAEPAYRLGRVVMTVGKSGHNAGYDVPAPVLEWSSLGNLEPFARFAEKTGWLRTWHGISPERSESWSLAGDDPDHEDSNGGSQYLVMRGRGTWSLANDPYVPFEGPCLLGFVHVLPDSLDDHRERFFRWQRQWKAWHETSTSSPRGGANATLAPWFEAGFPLLDQAASATAGDHGADVLECPYSADLYRYFRETWIVDGLHEITRWAMGGWREWDTMLGTLQSRGSHVFSALHPRVLGVRRYENTGAPLWPIDFGEQVPIVIPVTNSAAAAEIWKHRSASADLSPSVSEWSPSVSEQARGLQKSPAGWLIRQGEPPPGMMMVPTGFALLLQNPADSLDETTIIESAYRTPRLFGELEVDRHEMLPAASSVLVFSEANERAVTADVAPLSLSLAFTVTQNELFRMMGDHEHGGPQLRAALNRRIREVARTGCRHALFFSKDALGSMREWLYHEWRRLGGPVGDLASFPISKLLVAGVLGHGTPFARLRVDARWKAWTKKGLRRDLVKEGIIKLEKRGGAVTEYSRVHFERRPLDGAWETRFRREGRDQIVQRFRREALDRPATGGETDGPWPVVDERDGRPPVSGGSAKGQRDLTRVLPDSGVAAEGFERPR
jgi:hypothetical protein